MNASISQTNERLGVIIGRFQTIELHAGHRSLIDMAIGQSSQVLVLISTSEALPSARNPLCFEARKNLLQQAYPQVLVLPLVDHPSDDVWSTTIDAIITREFPEYSSTLFGSRECLALTYSGMWPLVTIPSTTDERLSVVRRDSSDFRSGVVWANSTRLALSYQTVDIALLRYPEQTVLLGKKHRKDGTRWRFIGGFVDPTDSSLEGSALRELREEAGATLQCHELHYLGSFRIDDPRYRDEPDAIMTAFFATYILGGTPVPGDDIDELQWFPLADIAELIIPEHRPLAESLIRFVTR